MYKMDIVSRAGEKIVGSLPFQALASAFPIYALMHISTYTLTIKITDSSTITHVAGPVG